LDARLVARYRTLVESHVNAVQAIASGIQSLPGVGGTSFAATQAAWRFFPNPRVTLPQLVQPLQEAGRSGAARSASQHVLVACDWSKLDFDGHRSKTDLTQLTQPLDVGYELATALLVDADQGHPLAPMGLTVLSRDGLYSTQSAQIMPREPHLQQVSTWMAASRVWNLKKTCVFVIDREADAVQYFRKWHADGHRFLVRGDDRRATFRGTATKLSAVRDVLRQEGAFQRVREVTLRGRTGQQWVAETQVVLEEPAWVNIAGRRQRLPGEPLTVRLVIAQVRNTSGEVLAEWLLLTNAADVPAANVALWYYWRWRIESFHKLLKSSGLEAEEWQQETASAIAKRLLVGVMACVTVWAIERDQTETGLVSQFFLMRLSGRQTKRKKPVTTPGLLAGLHQLLVMLDVLEAYTPRQLRDFAQRLVPHLRPSG
jgi:hypothetical protein